MKLKEFKKKISDDFKMMIKRSKKEDILKVKNGAYGLMASKWAIKYASPNKENEKYKIAYNVFYKYFNL